ncbi:hypothetical protein KDD93_06805 [Campylobacter sp. faydin G-24]|uniref:Chitin-binding type-3 domain-containing protein n=1 Tax=Campylobacter anatolicus TaxID=2829105 RepID=A0ABS5HJ20_9BACT|nr:carbohydrate-binding protein [Campylobacter anatolicus]MBR8464269.1 hypothetical protein [Campylobacter anatolicus]
MIYKRPDGKIFASSAKSGEVGVFDDIERGWGVTENTGYVPSLEQFNAIGKRTDEAIAYLMQNGVSEWDAGMQYKKGALVQTNAAVYKCIKPHNSTQNPNTKNSEYWSEVISYNELSQLCYQKNQIDEKLKALANKIIAYASKSTPNTAVLRDNQGDFETNKITLNKIKSNITTINNANVDLSLSDNFVINLSEQSVLTLSNAKAGESGVIIVNEATNITGYSSNIIFRVIPTGLKQSEVFAYFVQSEDSIRMGRV